MEKTQGTMLVPVDVFFNPSVGPAWRKALITACVLSGSFTTAWPLPRARAQASPAQIVGVIDTLLIARHARVLSADTLMGRATGTPQLAVAADYIATVCADIGLTPLAIEFKVPLPLTRVTVANGTGFDIETDGRRESLEHGTHFVVHSATIGTLSSFGGRAELVGTDEQIRSTTEPLSGTVAVTLGLITQQATHHLAERGASAMVHLVADSSAYQFLRESRGTSRIVADDSTTVSSVALDLPSVVLSPRHSAPLFVAMSRGANVMIRLQLETVYEPFIEHNVACLLKGTGTSNSQSVIAFTAHYDHLGVGAPDAAGDSIFNGFSDNASGVGMLLAIAAAAAAEPRSVRHDMAFIFFAAEEIGLIGSDYFVANPPVPLERFRAIINLDAGAPPAPPWSWRIAGGENSQLGRMAVDAALARGWSATTSSAVPNSDYFPFWRRGVPAIFIVPGPETFEGLSTDSSRVLRSRWDRYHKASDEWHPDFPMSGLKRYAEFALLVAQRVDRETYGDPIRPGGRL